MARDRRVHHQNDLQARALLVLTVACEVFLAWFSPFPGSVGFAPVVVFVYLMGPCTSIVVTPDKLVVRNTFHSWHVARSLITYPDANSWSKDELTVRGRRPISISAFEPSGLSFGMAALAGGPRWLIDTLSEIGPRPDDGLVTRRIRWVNVVLALAIAGTWAWAYYRW
ncbi:hypothetical protein [Winogradskya humida]|nr:hypothetical protein [Actinoplanes humidus]